ncbi:MULTISPECIES: hypothetical protein [unclassified Mesorhizobium]|uniref:hypothetical protein n=1 Tax=unclassified Mesorhizobium TaxID=325217 RepID=UPI0013ECD4BE|nr:MULTISPECIES: hypothetical protein [unclassified Mesorhizobium]
MDVRNLIGRLSAKLRGRHAALSPQPYRLIRASLSDEPLKPRPRPPHRPGPPVRPASNM